MSISTGLLKYPEIGNKKSEVQCYLFSKKVSIIMIILLYFPPCFPSEMVLGNRVIPPPLFLITEQSPCCFLPPPL